MKKLLIFGGASEIHGLLAALDKLPLKITLSVTSAYGRSLLPPDNAKLTVLTGPLDMPRMACLMREHDFCAVIDATHPYAAKASANISAAAKQNDLACLRLLRQASDAPGCLVVENAARAVAELNLNLRQGAVLLTTGSKELPLYAGVDNYRERLYCRVLPLPEALAVCAELGLAQNHIIAMQGPFSVALNAALIREFKIKTLVTKDGGLAGGFPQKLQAAAETGCRVILIRRPAESGPHPGLDMEELLARLAALIGE